MYSVLLHDHAFLVVLWLLPLISLFMVVETVDMELAIVLTVLEVVYLVQKKR